MSSNASVDTPSPSAAGDKGDKGELLARVELFSGLSAEHLAKLAERSSVRVYERGEVVWEMGDEANELLVVESGELAVLGPSTAGREELIGRILPGECVGEMALVLDERRSAKVQCSRRAATVVVYKDDFRVLARDDTRLLSGLTKLLSRRAVSLAQRRPVTGRPTVVGVAADRKTPGASLVARATARICDETLGAKALLVRVLHEASSGAARADPDRADLELRTRGGGPPVVDVTIDVNRAATVDPDFGRLVERALSAYGARFGLMVVDLPPASGGALALADSVCDRVIHVVSEPSVHDVRSPGTLQVVNRFSAPDLSIALNHCEPFVLPVEPLLEETAGEEADLLLADSSRPISRVLGRLARKVMGTTVGIALGGGGAFGIAHVGVLAALMDAGVPIDLVAGTSMGSIIAIGYAAGLEPSKMMEIAGRIGNVRTALSAIDPSLTGTGLLNGRRLMAIFAPFLPCRSFDDVVLPCRVVAMDVETGERVDIGTGRLDSAFRASCSIPVVFNPVRVGSRIVIDGGMIDPVPTDVVREMGADVVVAVNVVPHLERGVTTAISRSFKRANRLNPFSYLTGARDMPDMVDVFMNALQITEYELGNFKSLDADVLVNVDMAEFTWIDFHRALAMIERGREAGERVAHKVLSAMTQRLANVS